MPRQTWSILQALSGHPGLLEAMTYSLLMERRPSLGILRSCGLPLPRFGANNKRKRGAGDDDEEESSEREYSHSDDEERPEKRARLDAEGDERDEMILELLNRPPPELLHDNYIAIARALYDLAQSDGEFFTTLISFSLASKTLRQPGPGNKTTTLIDELADHVDLVDAYAHEVYKYRMSLLRTPTTDPKDERQVALDFFEERLAHVSPGMAALFNAAFHGMEPGDPRFPYLDPLQHVTPPWKNPLDYLYAFEVCNNVRYSLDILDIDLLYEIAFALGVSISEIGERIRSPFRVLRVALLIERDRREGTRYVIPTVWREFGPIMEEAFREMSSMEKEKPFWDLIVGWYLDGDHRTRADLGQLLGNLASANGEKRISAMRYMTRRFFRALVKHEHLKPSKRLGNELLDFFVRLGPVELDIVLGVLWKAEHTHVLAWAVLQQFGHVPSYGSPPLSFLFANYVYAPHEYLRRHSQLRSEAIKEAKPLLLPDLQAGLANIVTHPMFNRDPERVASLSKHLGDLLRDLPIYDITTARHKRPDTITEATAPWFRVPSTHAEKVGMAVQKAASELLLTTPDVEFNVSDTQDASRVLFSYAAVRRWPHAFPSNVSALLASQVAEVLAYASALYAHPSDAGIAWLDAWAPVLYVGNSHTRPSSTRGFVKALLDIATLVSSNAKLSMAFLLQTTNLLSQYGSDLRVSLRIFRYSLVQSAHIISALYCIRRRFPTLLDTREKLRVFYSNFNLDFESHSEIVQVQMALVVLGESNAALRADLASEDVPIVILGYVLDLIPYLPK